jgi:hypothetical protein
MSGFSPGNRECFLIQLYFGIGNDLLGLCIDRAYRDMSRTLHGISSHPHAPGLHRQSSQLLREGMVELRERNPPITQEDFDAWHEQTCQRLQQRYRDGGYGKFSVGQAQKWVNMAFNYVFIMGEDPLPGYGHLFAHGHAPLDRIFLDRLVVHGLARMAVPWSRMESYQEYVAIQRWIRRQFDGRSALDVEFELFLNSVKGQVF